MATPNLGLTIPVGGTTPGASNNTTAGTYPYIWSGNLNIIDANCLSIPNNPAKVSNGGIVIDGNLSFGGFGITNASTFAFSGAGSIAGLLTLSGSGTALTVTNNATVGGTLTVGTISTVNMALTGTLSVGGISTFGQGLANTIAIAGSATTVDPTITVAGDATRNLSLVVKAASATTIAGLSITNSSGGGPIFLGSSSNSGYGAIWVGASAATATGTNYTFQSNLSSTILNAPSSGGLAFYIAATTNVMNLGSSSLSMVGIPIVQGTASTALTLKGNAAGTSGTAIVLGNIGTQTSGTIVSIENPIGTQKASFAFNGALNLVASGTLSTTLASTGITTLGSAAAGGIGLNITNSVDVGGTGYSAAFQGNSTNQYAITGRGHLIPLSAMPTVGSFNGGFGGQTGVSVTGSDSSMLVNFTPTTPTLIATGSALFVVTLNQAYSATTYTAIAAMNNNPSVVTTIPLLVIQTAVNQLTVYNLGAWTPTAAAYKISIITQGAGATS